MKKVLLIAPIFFNYYKEIISELKNQNCDVDFIRDSASESNIYKAINRVNKRILKIPMKKYFNKQMKFIKEKKYDYIILIAGMTFSFDKNMIAKIKENQKQAIFVMYQWDGENNIPYVKDIHEYFDKVYSFDRNDCINNKLYKFLPLFYIKKYENIGTKKNKYSYDVSYVGTAHPKKYKMINKMSNELKELLPRQCIYQYLPSKLKFIYHKIKSKDYKKAKISDFKYKKLSSDEITEIYKKSKCIFDSPQDGQVGLTIRTIECIGAKKKIITTNEDIKNYDFYCEENILIYNKNYKTNIKFFESAYKEIPTEIYKKYSLSSWVSEILKN